MQQLTPSAVRCNVACFEPLQLIRLRQAVDHPYLVVHSNTASNAAADAAHDAAAATAAGSSAAAAADAQFLLPGQYRGEHEEMHPDALAMRAAGGDAAAVAAAAAAGSSGLTCADDGCCGLCHDPREDSVTAGCGHSFCRTCVVEYIDAVTKVGIFVCLLGGGGVI